MSPIRSHELRIAIVKQDTKHNINLWIKILQKYSVDLTTGTRTFRRSVVAVVLSIVIRIL